MAELMRSRVPESIREMVEDARDAAERKRQEAAAELLDYYHSDADDSFAAAMRKAFAKPEEKLGVQVNTVRKPVNLLAGVFNRPARFEVRRRRTGAKIPSATDLFNWIVERGGWHRKLKTANRWQKLLQTLHVRVHPVGLRDPARARLGLDLIAPENTIVRQRVDAPEEFEAIGYSVHKRNDSIAVEPGDEFVIWTEDKLLRVDSSGKMIPIKGNPRGVNPYGPTIPVVKLDDIEPRGDRYWNRGRVDLVAINRVLNLMLTGLAHGTWSQGWTQILVTGIKEELVKIAGPDSVWVVDQVRDGIQPPTLQSTQLISDLGGMRDSVEFMLQLVAMLNEIPSDEFSIEGPAPESGFAKMIGRLNLLEERRDDVEKWNGWLQELYRVTAKVWAVEVATGRLMPRDAPNLQPLPEDAELAVDFAEPEFPEDPTKEQERLFDLIRKGLASPVDAVIALVNPDLDRAEAIAYLEEIREEREQLEWIMKLFSFSPGGPSSSPPSSPPGGNRPPPPPSSGSGDSDAPPAEGEDGDDEG